MPPEQHKCNKGAPPVVRLALATQKCARQLTEKARMPEAVIAYLKKEYGCEAQEWAVAVGTDAANHVLGVQEVAIGGIDQSMVDPRVLFAGLLLMGARAFIFCHNHPSGESQPSVADVSLTRRLNEIGNLLSIQMLDHIIVTGEGYTSFRSQGMMPANTYTHAQP